MKILLFLLFCCCATFSFPSRPLNERSTELAWQAWLLVDDQQNQHKQTLAADNFPRRRITPKSVFIAPTFSPESLPACADGYRPDPMGRCIKIIKLDEEAHLEFLLEKLNAQFGNYDDAEEETQENGAAAGPFQLNIPLNTQEGPTKGLDIAIVVAPTNGNFGAETTTAATTTTAALGIANADKIIPSHNEANRPPVDETNNSKRRTEPIPPATEQTTDITTTFETTLTTTSYKINQQSIASSITDETTITDQHALFFLQPSSSDNSEHVQNGTRNVNDTPVVVTSNDNNKTSSNNSLTTLPNSTFSIDASIDLNNKILSLFTNRERTEYTTSPSLVRFPSDEQTTQLNYIKFPEQISKIRILPQSRPNDQFEHKTPPSSEHPIYQTIFKGYLNPNGSNNLKGNEHFTFKDVTNLPGGLVSDPINGNRDANTNNNQVFNHRNRDKNSNLWSVPSSWSQSSPKPIVLRFSRRASNSRHLLAEQLQPQMQNSQAFYREFPPEDFSYIFGREKNANYKQNPR